jgi:uncharacterized protein HemY
VATDPQTARQALERAWQQLTAAQRQEPQLVLAYAEQLRQGAQSEAEQVLRTALKRNTKATWPAFMAWCAVMTRRVSCKPPKAG